jgi:hypothetical protein
MKIQDRLMEVISESQNMFNKCLISLVWNIFNHWSDSVVQVSFEDLFSINCTIRRITRS